VSGAGRPTHGDWDAVLETSQVYEAELAALRLRSAGLEARVIDQSYRQEPVPFVPGLARVRVLVPAASAVHARAVLAEGEGLPEDTREAEGEER
jgi:hypothetical protein